MAAVLNYQGELQNFMDTVMNADSDLAKILILSGSFQILINISQLLTNSLCGPLGTNIAGTLKDVALTYIGFAFFGDA